MSRDEALALVQQLLNAAERHDLAQVIALYHDDAVAFSPVRHPLTHGTLVSCNAGHNPPVLISDRAITRLTTGGPIVGMFDAARFDEQRLQLCDGDTLVMFTDGLTEARSRSDEEFGEERLLAAMEHQTAAPPGDMLQRVFAAVREFCGGAEPIDDITVTVTRFRRS